MAIKATPCWGKMELYSCFTCLLDSLTWKESNNLSDYTSLYYYDMTSSCEMVRTNKQLEKVGETWCHSLIFCSFSDRFMQVFQRNDCLLHLHRHLFGPHIENSSEKLPNASPAEYFLHHLSHQPSASVISKFVSFLRVLFLTCFTAVKPFETCLWYWLVCANIKAK